MAVTRYDLYQQHPKMGAKRSSHNVVCAVVSVDGTGWVGLKERRWENCCQSDMNQHRGQWSGVQIYNCVGVVEVKVLILTVVVHLTRIMRSNWPQMETDGCCFMCDVYSLEYDPVLQIIALFRTWQLALLQPILLTPSPMTLVGTLRLGKLDLSKCTCQCGSKLQKWKR